MTKTIFVTATGTNVGKTYATLKIMEFLASKGLRVAPFKPIETGVQDTPLDAFRLLQKYKKLYKDELLSLDDICLYRFELPAAPYVAKGKLYIDVQKIKIKLQELKNQYDVVVIEGAGGVFVPIERDYFMIDLAKECADLTLLVSHSGLGCINDTLLSKKALEDVGVRHIVIFNRRKNDNFETISKPFFESYFEKIYHLDDLKYIL